MDGTKSSGMGKQTCQMSDWLEQQTEGELGQTHAANGITCATGRTAYRGGDLTKA